MTFDFALQMIEFSEDLQGKSKFVVADQLSRSGCAVGALIREAQHAESSADFIHKLKIATKEAEETQYWLALCHQVKKYPDPGKLLADIESIIKVLAKIIELSKKK